MSLKTQTASVETVQIISYLHLFTCIYFIGLHLFSKQAAEGKGFISPVE